MEPTIPLSLEVVCSLILWEFGSYCRHLLIFNLKSGFVAISTAMEKTTLFSRALLGNSFQFEFGPVALGSVKFVYMFKERTWLSTCVLYSAKAKEFCLIVGYTMLLMLPILLWLSDIWFIFRRCFKKKKLKILA